MTGSGAVLHALVTFPSEIPRLSVTKDLNESDAVADAARVADWVDENLSVTAKWLTTGAIFWFEDRTRAVWTPSTWQRENTSLAKRVERANAALAEVEQQFRVTAGLMAVVFGGGFLAGLAMARRPGFGAYFGALAVPLLASPVGVDAVIGVNDDNLFYGALPMALAAGGLILLRFFTRSGASRSELAQEGWAIIQSGVVVVILGSAVTVGGIIWVMESNGEAVLCTAVFPVVYGFYLIFKGIVALRRSRSEGR